MRFEPCVADRRRPHVDAAAALPEVEPGADHRDGLRRRAPVSAVLTAPRHASELAARGAR